MSDLPPSLSEELDIGLLRADILFDLINALAVQHCMYGSKQYQSPVSGPGLTSSSVSLCIRSHMLKIHREQLYTKGSHYRLCASSGALSWVIQCSVMGPSVQ